MSSKAKCALSGTVLLAGIFLHAYVVRNLFGFYEMSDFKDSEYLAPIPINSFGIMLCGYGSMFYSRMLHAQLTLRLGASLCAISWLILLLLGLGASLLWIDVSAFAFCGFGAERYFKEFSRLKASRKPGFSLVASPTSVH